MTNSLLLERLQAVHDELETVPVVGSEEFMLLALAISRTTTRAAFAELITAAQAGKTDVELVASVPLAVGFLLNCVLNACGCDGNADVADRLFDKIRTVVRELGDGAHQHLSVSPISCH